MAVAASAFALSNQSSLSGIIATNNKVASLSRFAQTKFLSINVSERRRRALELGNLQPLRAVKVGGIEPDLSEEPIDYYRTPGVSEEDFPYGKADGAHTWHEGDDGEFVEEFVKVFKESGGPTGLQGVISWLYLPGLLAGMILDIPGDYLFIYTALFIFAFVGIEMAKPDQPFNFEPEIYNIERKARDKFIEDYNSMSIWEFNEKYKK